jgi:hypothetical protein
MLVLYTMLLDDIVFNKRQEVTALKLNSNIPKIKELIKQLPRPRNFLKAFPKGLALSGSYRRKVRTGLPCQDL